MKELCLLLPEGVCVLLSVDDKAKVPVGMNAVGRTFFILHHNDALYCSDDHDFPFSSGHKLIPSFCVVVLRNGAELERKKITCFTRSQLFSSSTSKTHFEDFKRMIAEESTRVFICDEAGDVKPVLCISVDGGPDENPRHWKNILQYAQYFLLCESGFYVRFNACTRPIGL